MRYLQEAKIIKSTNGGNHITRKKKRLKTWMSAQITYARDVVEAQVSIYKDRSNCFMAR